jgi:hypothetical protein
VAMTFGDRPKLSFKPVDFWPWPVAAHPARGLAITLSHPTLRQRSCVAICLRWHPLQHHRRKGEGLSRGPPAGPSSDDQVADGRSSPPGREDGPTKLAVAIPTKDLR